MFCLRDTPRHGNKNDKFDFVLIRVCDNKFCVEYHIRALSPPPAWLLLSLLLLIGRIFVYNVLLCKVKKRTRIGLIERKREAYAS